MKLKLKKRNFKQLTQLNNELENQNTPRVAGGRAHSDFGCDITGKKCPATLTCRACGSRRC
ncbi:MULTISPECIES: hypothetical protein [Pseudoalteromonas]|uniref:Uncharacterized protein n=1 Tax=Pseudoalteromonas obscura TaxID=3048491 RepID=A0ABT7EMC5_9GAMM|nr:MULTISPECIES: hypothetical protein [Pseudoalteromonas]MBQ4837840.1 hypothetical protein [Pseudoalteromonas luteoviolacea]MDK2596215.1 hypothetical protein [Pseudoalteromonas sp. P94(2023)]